jgi:hypothetical protein
MSDLIARCECRIHRCAAKILFADDREIPKGFLKLSTERGRGHFVPTPPTNLFQNPEVQVTAIVEQGGHFHRHRLLRWEYYQDATIGGVDGPLLAGYFVFESDEEFPFDSKKSA